MPLNTAIKADRNKMLIKNLIRFSLVNASRKLKYKNTHLRYLPKKAFKLRSGYWLNKTEIKTTHVNICNGRPSMLLEGERPAQINRTFPGTFMEEVFEGQSAAIRFIFFKK